MIMLVEKGLDYNKICYKNKTTNLHCYFVTYEYTLRFKILFVHINNISIN